MGANLRADIATTYNSYQNWNKTLQLLPHTLCHPQLARPVQGAQWLSGRVLDLGSRGRGLEHHWRRCVVVLEQDTFILA